ncbi:MAG: serpin family protein [Gemmatimonadetes bacterium]|nr:serpin family protein [Gemmatimonadota bacterium]
MRSATRLHRSLLFLLLLGGCGDPSGPGSEPWKSIQLDERIVHAYTDFGLNLFGALAADAPASNIFVSPTSAAFALAMTYNGTAGETARQMARALGVEGMTIEDANRANREWLDALASTGDRKVELSIANSLWIRQGFPIQPDFLERNQTFYQAEVQELDFSSPAAVKTINDWASRSTRGRIPEIVDEIGDEVLFLVNALYFKGDWAHQFDKRRTRPEPFTLPNGQRKSVQMMRQEMKFPYYRGDGFALTSLPYGSGRFSMVLALPDEQSDLAGFYAKLNAASLEQWIAGQAGTIEVALPRFTVEWEETLNDVLIALGIEDAFDELRADFAGINPNRRDLHISEVKQKTFLKVDEEGTEAAAVTSVGVQPTSASPALIFNRPFFLAIRDNATGTVLFMGQITDPS